LRCSWRELRQPDSAGLQLSLDVAKPGLRLFARLLVLAGSREPAERLLRLLLAIVRDSHQQLGIARTRKTSLVAAHEGSQARTRRIHARGEQLAMRVRALRLTAAVRRSA